jgi:hypothetical protein
LGTGMTMRTRVLVLFSLLSVAAACSATSDHGTPSSASSKSTIPEHHRAVASSCAPTPLPAQPPNPLPSNADGEGEPERQCATHADCTAGPNGRCVDVIDCNPSTALCGTHCVYEACTKDDDCGGGSACFCSDDSTFCPRGYATACPLTGEDLVCACGIANRCKKGNCRVDSDCGQGGYCSPAVDECGGVLGYYCHQPADECVDDADCLQRDAGGQPFFACLPDTTASDAHWVCARLAECP